MRGFAVIGILAAILPLAGCGSYGSKTRLTDTVYAPVPAAIVKVLFEKPDRPYEVIGVVSADGGTWTTPGQLYKKLQKCAADLGADAVLITGEGSYGTYVVPGVSTTTGSATTYGNATAIQNGNSVDAYGNAATYGSATTTSTPTYGADLPRDKGLAIKYTSESNADH
jgi:hypothetical protein